MLFAIPTVANRLIGSIAPVSCKSVSGLTHLFGLVLVHSHQPGVLVVA